MSNDVPILDLTTAGIKELGKLSAAQAGTRGGVIRLLDELTDTLQLACDLVSKEMSTTLAEYNELRGGTDRMRGSFLGRVAVRYSEPSLWILLHEGKVCGQLHTLADRFETPFSKEVLTSIPAWEAIATFFTRTNTMSQALGRLRDGEREYLRDIARFLDDVRLFAEGHRYDQGPALEKSCDELAGTLRTKRAALQKAVYALRHAADDCVAQLH